MKRINLLGMGLIGQERLKAIELLKSRGEALEVSSVCDPYVGGLDELAKKHRFQVIDQPKALLELPCDLLIIACPHDIAPEYVKQALRFGRKVLLEKPLGRNLPESEDIVAHAKKDQLWVGFNYRYMPGITSLFKDCQSGKFGRLISLSIHLGHGGKPEDKGSWKLDPVRCGGGALLDPGIHILDLLLNIIDDSKIVPIGGAIWRGFWGTGIEEEAHLLLQCGEAIANLQISIVRWRSRFEFQINGSEAYGIVTGRGKSYGNQTYRFGEKWAWKGGQSQKETENVQENLDCETSFADELAACLGFNYPIIGRQDLAFHLDSMRFYEKLRRGVESGGLVGRIISPRRDPAF